MTEAGNHNGNSHCHKVLNFIVDICYKPEKNQFTGIA